MRSDIAEVRIFLAADDGATAHEKIQDLLKTHEGSAELIRHLPSVQDSLLESLYLMELAERAAAREAEGNETPEIPFSATVVKYNEKTGQFKLRWEGEAQLRDFNYADGLFIFPLDLSGKFRVGFEVSAYPNRGQIEIDIVNSAGRTFEVDCGLDGEGLNRSVARVDRVENGGNELLQRMEKKLPKPDKQTMISLKSLGASLQILNGRSKMLSFKLPKGEELGRVHFKGFKEEILVAVEYDGPLDMNSMAGVLAAKKARDRIAFRNTIKLTEILPEWLHPYLHASYAGLDGVVPPGGELKDEDEKAAWKWAMKCVDNARASALPMWMLIALQDDSPESLTPVRKEYASLQIAYEGGYWKHAEGHARNVLKLDPTHRPTRQLKLEIMARQELGDAAWTAAMEYYAEEPEDSSPIIHAALVLMQLNMQDDLAYFLEDDEVLPEALKQRCLDIVKHRDPPVSEGMKAHNSSSLELTTDLPGEEAQEISKWMAGEIHKASGYLPGGTLDSSDKLRLYLLNDRWDYDEFSAEVIGRSHPSEAGFFSQEYDAVIAWNNPNKEELHNSLRREMMIHIGKRIHPSYPVWSCIGLSELVMDGSMTPKKVAKELGPRASSLYRQAKTDGIIPFASMLRMSDTVFYALESERPMEAQAWLMSVLLMVWGKAAGVDIMDVLIEYPRAGKSWTEVADYVIYEADPSGKFHQIYFDFVDALEKHIKK